MLPANINTRSPVQTGDKARRLLSQRGTLSFTERVAYQRAIEEIYWRHQIWPKERPDAKPYLDAVMTRAQLEKEVTDYERKSQALEDYWHRPITAEQLQAEMDRMAQHTKQPDVLHELFEALGNDPFVIAECLARPMLAERLLMNWHSYGQIIGGELTQSAEADLRAHPILVARKNEPMSSLSTANELPTAMVAQSDDYTLPEIPDTGGCINDTWTATSLTNAPAGRFGHTAVWTGTEMIVWGGGTDNHGFNNGARYNPSTDSWRSASTRGVGGAAVWTGTEMIVWGASAGGKYNPLTNTWTATSTTDAPSYRNAHTAVWTGSEMIVWGGVDAFGFALNTGGKYNPNTNSWTPTSTTNAPTARTMHTAVWTGSEMIIWGGWDGLSTILNNGSRYNPGTDSWTATSVTNAPSRRAQHTAVWTGSEMIVWGGANLFGGLPFNTGGRYNPSTNSWTATSITNAPSGRNRHTAVWTLSEMIIWGGSSTSALTNTGGRYDPSTNTWTAISTADAPAPRLDATAVWTGNQMLIWGGWETYPNGLDTGGRYCAPGPESLLGNISTRAFVQTGDNVMIGGFIVQGTTPKRVIIRAIGPELSRFGVPNVLVDPTLELHDSTGALIASNDNWQHTTIGGIITRDQVRDIQNSGHAPADPSESAIIADMPGGNYTAIVRGVSDTTGVALVEVYDLSADTGSLLSNISTRSFIQTEADVMIGGFIIEGTGPKTVILRGIGPELAQFGVPNPLVDPRLELHNATGALIASNDNWLQTIIGGIITVNQVQEIRNSGHAPTDPRESAIIATLPPGNYTAIVRGVNNTTGVGLVEVYD
jgi:N-acetylneuraminic acid mutarotase